MSAARQDVGIAETARIVDEIGLPSCPPVLAELASEAARPVPDVAKAERIVTRDAELALAVLQAVNAPLNGLPEKVATVGEAVDVIGLRGCANLVAGLLFKRMLLSMESTWIRAFWDDVSQLALVTAYLARELGIARFDDAYTFGLFRHGGVPALMKRYAGYRSAYDAGHADAVATILEEERSRFGVDHARASAVLARGWRLPESIWCAIQLHHVRDVPRSGGARTPELRMAAVGLLADCLESAHRCPDGVRSWAREEGYAMRVLGVAAPTLDALRPDVALMLQKP